VRDSHDRDAVDVVHRHQPRDVGERRVGLAGEDAGVHRVGHGRVLESGHQIAAVIGLDRAGGHGDLLIVRELSLTLTDLSVNEMYDAVGSFGDGVVVADDDHRHTVMLARRCEQVERTLAAL
jgi:hypothetical protein